MFFICRPSFPRFSVFGFRFFRVFGFPVFRFSVFFSAAFRLSADKGKRWRDAVASIWVGLVDTPTLQVSFLYFVFHNTIPLWWMMNEMNEMRWDECDEGWMLTTFVDVDVEVSGWLSTFSTLWICRWICRFLNKSDPQIFWCWHDLQVARAPKLPLPARLAQGYPQGWI